MVSAQHRPADLVGRRHGTFAGPVVAGLALLAALVATDAAGVPLRDPDHVSLRRLGLAAALTLLLVGIDIVVRAARRSGRRFPSRAELRRVRRERWTPVRGVAVATALVSFFVTYLAYRNLKSVVPLLRPDELYDGRLADLDRSLFAGHDPADLLHSLVGTGLPAQALSGAYMLFFVFIPVSLAAALAYFGWHYVLDDLGGLLIAVAALAMARALAGAELLSAGRLRAPTPSPA